MSAQIPNQYQSRKSLSIHGTGASLYQFTPPDRVFKTPVYSPVSFDNPRFKYFEPRGQLKINTPWVVGNGN